jgi:hypothetical protein
MGVLLEPKYYRANVWLGWAYLAKKVPHAATMPIVTAVVCFLSTQNMVRVVSIMMSLQVDIIYTDVQRDHVENNGRYYRVILVL